MTAVDVSLRARAHPHLVPLWRGLVVYRAVALVAVVVNAVRFGGQWAHPALGVAVVAAMAVWTVVSSTRYLRTGDPVTACLDLVLTALATASTLLVDTPQRVADGGPVITTVWSAGPVLALAIALGWRGGLGGALVTVTVLFGVRRVVDTDLLFDAQLLLVAGLAVGLAADTMRRSVEKLRAATALEAATAERERLARDIHDGVLQVLALVRRRGAELARVDRDASALDLARLAGEQEVALRRLITSAPVAGPDGTVDLSSRLAGVVPAHASLAVPAEPVLLPAAVVDELAAVVREAAHNAAAHAGEDAGLWVLVEDDAARVTVSLRDDGVGIPEGRLEQAAAEGHLGVAGSMRGRVQGLGGTIDLHTAPGEGTEWEIMVPRSLRSRHRQ
ncbi:MacS family sensor histidine kinase [Actinomycetospora rhizophila]|uniref:MacS family sensor histidine kinase n=1 Tax=Actinomycetospora rhizophila TaxID=1416876 RepID=A0ABV9ZC70_9PSEU